MWNLTCNFWYWGYVDNWASRKMCLQSVFRVEFLMNSIKKSHFENNSMTLAEKSKEFNTFFTWICGQCYWWPRHVFIYINTFNLIGVSSKNTFYTFSTVANQWKIIKIQGILMKFNSNVHLKHTWFCYQFAYESIVESSNFALAF